MVVVKSIQKQFAAVTVLVLFLSAAVFLLFWLFESGRTTSWQNPEPSVIQPPENPEESEPQPAPSYSRESVSFYAVGDNLIHGAIFRRAQLADGRYDFTENYRYVKDTVSAADIAVINQETVINDYAPAAHYPMFSTPLEMLQTLTDLGFDAANVASNHMLDQGKAGLINSLEHFQKSSIVTSGAFLGKDDRDKVRIVERKGIRFSFIGVTYGTNGIPVPEGEELLINLIEDENTVRDQIRKARQESDFVILMAHWGTEYSDREDPQQKAYAQKLADWGADLIIGHHPHVIQPVDFVTSADGRKVYVAYSLGNFISAQDQVKRLIGAGLSFQVTRHEDGSFTVNDLYAEPLVTQAEDSFMNIRVYRWEDYDSALAEKHVLRNHGWSKEALAEHFKFVMGDYARLTSSESESGELR